MLYRRAAEIMDGERSHSIVDRRWGQMGIEALKSRAQIPGQQGLGGVLAPQRASGPEGFVIPRINALPAKLVPQMLGKGRLDQPIFAIDAGYGHNYPTPMSMRPLCPASQTFPRHQALDQRLSN